MVWLKFPQGVKSEFESHLRSDRVAQKDGLGEELGETRRFQQIKTELVGMKIN